MTSGLQPADLIIVAGRPSMGKTTFAMNLVENAVLRSDKAVLVYSLEMPGESLIMRMLSSLGRIDQTKVRSGQPGRRRLAAPDLGGQPAQRPQAVHRRYRRHQPVGNARPDPASGA